MWEHKIRNRFLIMIAVLILAISLAHPWTVFGHAPSYQEKAWLASQTVTVNGTLAAGEWQDAPKIIVGGFASQTANLEFQLKHNDTSLLVAINKSSLGGNNNRVSLTFDANHNGALDAGDRGLQLVFGGSSTSMVLESYPGAAGAWGASSNCSTWSGWSASRNTNSLEITLPSVPNSTNPAL
jgi:hypothetical protein